MRKLVLGVVALALAACGEVIPLDPDAAVDAQEIDAVPDPCDATSLDPPTFASCLARAVCSVYEDCVGSDTSHLDCEQLSIEIVGGLSPEQLKVMIMAGMAANRVTWNGTAAKACYDGLIGSNCSIFKNDGDPLAACGLTTGRVANGALCQNDIECQQPGARCEANTGGGANQCIDYTCKPPAAVGAFCTNGAFCGIGDHCVPKNAGGTDISFCGAGTAGSMCDSDQDCDRGFYCQGGLDDRTAMGTCQMSKAAGASCRTDDECMGELACVGNFNAINGVCRDVRQPNAVCDNNSFLGGCFGHQTCENPGANMTGMCHAAPNLGQPCALRDGTAQFCGFFMSCEGGLCREPGAIGDPCSVSTGDISNNPAACNSGLFCDKDLTGQPSGVCRAAQANGSRCTQQNQCESDFCGGAMPNQTCMTFPVCTF